MRTAGNRSTPHHRGASRCVALLAALTVLGGSMSVAPAVSGAAASTHAQRSFRSSLPSPGVIDTIAGGGPVDGAVATQIATSPSSVATDASGNVYIAAADDHLVVRFDATSALVTIVAGNGLRGFSGDGGPASSAQIDSPAGVAVDEAGNVFIADTSNNRIRRVDAATGTISTILGNGTAGSSGDGGPASSAQVDHPRSVAVDGSGNLYIPESNSDRVRRVDATTGVIATVAGGGTDGLGDGGPATSAQLDFPRAVAVNDAGDLFIGDSGNALVRRVDATSGVITTVAGGGTDGLGDGGPATSAQFGFPDGVAVDDAGDLYISDSDDNLVRRVDATSGVITTVAGTGDFGSTGDGGAAVLAQVSPNALATDAAGNLYVADTYNHRLRRVDAATGTITTAAGNGTVSSSGDGGSASDAQVGVHAVAIDASGNLYIADSENYRVRRVDVLSGTISTVAGDGEDESSGDGSQATNASVNPSGVVVDASGDLYIADQNHNSVRRVDASTGVIATIAGTGDYGFSGDGGQATDATLDAPTGVAVNDAGDLFIADSGNKRVRRVDAATGVISTVAGGGSEGLGDGGPGADAALSFPYAVALDGSGNLFIADSDQYRVRRVDAATGVISTVAGNGAQGFAGDGGVATGASLNNPSGVSVDPSGNVYIADSSNNRVRRVDAATGVISTVAGTGDAGFSGDGGPAIEAAVDDPSSVATDGSGNVYVADMWSRRVRVVGAAPRPAPGSVLGRVTDSVSGDPLADICVFAYAGDDWDNATSGTCTNATGDFAMWLAQGSYTIAFFDPRGVYATTWAGGALEHDGASPVTISAGTATNADQSLLSSGSVSGSVTDAGSGEALANVCVLAWQASSVVQSSCTDTEGHYALTGLPAGSYTLSFTDMDGRNRTTWLGGAETQAASTPISIGPSPVVGDVALPPVSFDLRGRTNVGECVYLYDATATTFAGYGTCTNASGYFSFDGVAPGDYTLAFADSRGVLDTFWYGKDGSDPARPVSAAEAATVSVDGMSSSDLGFVDGRSLFPSTSLGGQVTGPDGPASNVCIYAYRTDFDYSSFTYVVAPTASWATCTNAAGGWRVDGLEQLKFYVLAISDPTGTLPTQWFGSEPCADSTCSYRGSSPISDRSSAMGALDPGNDLHQMARVATGESGFDIDLFEGAQISGTVRNADGSAKVGACVYVDFASDGSYVGRGVVTDDQGHYTLENLAASDNHLGAGYKVGFYETCAAGQPPTGHWNGGASSEAAATEVHVSPGSVTTGIDAQF